MKLLGAVYRKEMIDGLRDRRSLLSSFFFPFLAPLFIYGLMTLMIEQNTKKETIELPVIGAEHAPALIQHLVENGIAITPFTEDAEQAIRDKTVDLVLEIPADYQASMAAFELTRVGMIHDGSRNDTRATVSRVRQLIRNYSNELNALRLISRGISPRLIQGVQPKNEDIASEEQRAANLLNYIPIYVLMAAFVCGLGLAIDTTAGERERRSLEPLLINPVPRLMLIFGKWLAASTLSAVGMFITLMLCLWTMLALPLDELGLRFSLEHSQIPLLVLAILPVPLLACSLQLLLGLFAKSFKDAQSYIGILVIIPVLPSLVLQFYPVTTSLWMYLIPILGQSLMIKEILGAEPVAVSAYFLSLISTLAASVSICFIAARLLNQERVIQG
ncbi:MAG: ABC transporter permease [Pseudomonadales bacterium]